MAESEKKVLILRFRDLSTQRGETIEFHKQIIIDNEYVWWAWWKKGHELLPTSALGEFLISLKENAITVYLVDSGQKKLYKAFCNGIECSKETPKLSPEGDKTPDYYNSTPYYAWFKFNNIEECENDEIRNYSYLDVEGLFVDGTADYSMFRNKRIYSIDELIQQNRTMWLAREFRDGDKEHEITLLNANIVEPCYFSRKYYEAKGNSLLWVSDLHFSNSAFPKTASTTNTTLEKHIKESCGDLFTDISGLIISGDITDCAKKEGFDVAHDFIKGLNRDTKENLGSSNIIICPGNHDFIRKNEEIHDTFDFVTPDSDTSKDYSDFYKSIYYISPNNYFAVGRKLLLKCGITVEIVALNSNMLQQYNNFEGHGYISEKQMEYIEKEMHWDDTSTSAIRIVVMHHHYLPACLEEEIDEKKASSTVYDANRFMEWIVKNNVKVVLHGHKHNKFIAKVSYLKRNNLEININEDFHDVLVVGMGGTGIKTAENIFSLISFRKNEAEINFYKIYADKSKSGEHMQRIIIPIKE